MSDREQLLYELEKTPDILIKEILNFLLFIHTKTVRSLWFKAIAFLVVND